ncbi:hypothetical protein, partial [Piscinibacter sp.]|uniref:hypothetical protein n=1 Tax=Piscinibacter sp. TaxID=1903157 RepID=UPI0035593BB2
MSKVLQWFAGIGLRFRRVERPAEPDGYSAFEHIDGGFLGTTDFRLSSSMRIDDAPLRDFAETMPACTYGPAPVRSPKQLR